MINAHTGRLHYYCGNGKGKSTAAFGLALRAAGRNMRTLVVQFMKTSNRYGELKTAAAFPDEIVVRQMGAPCKNPDREKPGFECTGCMMCHVDPSDPQPEHVEAAGNALLEARRGLQSGDFDIVVMDEAGYALEMGLVNPESVASVLDKRKPEVEVVITGGRLNPELASIADYVTEFGDIKHHIRQGIVEVRGIDF